MIFVVPKFSPPTYLPPFILCSFHHQSLGELEAGGEKKKGRTRSQKYEDRSGNQEKTLEIKGQKQEGRSERAKVSERAEQELEGKLLSFSWFFFWFSCVFFLSCV